MLQRCKSEARFLANKIMLEGKIKVEGFTLNRAAVHRRRRRGKFDVVYTIKNLILINILGRDAEWVFKESVRTAPNHGCQTERVGKKNEQETRNKKQETRNKKQETRNKKQETRNKKQETRNKKQETRNKKQETRNKKQETRNKKQETRNKKQETRNKKQETRNKKQETRNKKQETRNKKQETRNKKQETRNKKQETRNKKQETRNKKQELLMKPAKVDVPVLFQQKAHKLISTSFGLSQSSPHLTQPQTRSSELIHWPKGTRYNLSSLLSDKKNEQVKPFGSGNSMLLANNKSHFPEKMGQSECLWAGKTKFSGDQLEGPLDFTASAQQCEGFRTLEWMLAVGGGCPGRQKCKREDNAQMTGGYPLNLYNLQGAFGLNLPSAAGKTWPHDTCARCDEMTYIFFTAAAASLPLEQKVFFAGFSTPFFRDGVNICVEVEEAEQVLCSSVDDAYFNVTVSTQALETSKHIALAAACGRTSIEWWRNLKPARHHNTPSSKPRVEAPAESVSVAALTLAPVVGAHSLG
ncbi:Av71 muscle cell intermediate filament [Culex quinquefasciatus]|uniref:Av71 muscle cell intermediate filament n=1 Tax=Culex quinquefasciatus TaxID=7176 RepID=B0XJD4_CULQU|nr:Av71 muscle cell intermediate filament [Culex quinquefasciatus]|eukprot:XP_001869756.1 Av71 muscle cell intermediate filament [Culex quinquefasciatus]